MALQVAVLVMLGTATKLKTSRTINGTNFDGSSNILTTKWGTARNLALSGAVSGSASVDGSGNVTITTTQANIAVVTGTIELSNGSGSATANYPSGYNSSNSVVIAVSAGRMASNNPIEYYAVGSSTLLGVYLQANNIKLQGTSLAGSGPSATVKYQIVLMKIS